MKVRTRIALKPPRQRVALNPPPQLEDPDLVARKLLVAAFLYYVLDEPITMSDGEYDKMSIYVSKNWSKLHPDRQWALGNPTEMRSSGMSFKFSSQVVFASFMALKAKGITPNKELPTIWKVRPPHGTRYVTAHYV